MKPTEEPPAYSQAQVSLTTAGHPTAKYTVLLFSALCSSVHWQTLSLRAGVWIYINKQTMTCLMVYSSTDGRDSESIRKAESPLTWQLASCWAFGQRSGSAGGCSYLWLGVLAEGDAVGEKPRQPDEITCASRLQYSWVLPLLVLPLERIGFIPKVETENWASQPNSLVLCRYFYQCVDVLFVNVCVCVGAVARSCRAVEETGGAGKEGRRAGPPGERDAVTQRFRRSASNTNIQRLSYTVS